MRILGIDPGIATIGFGVLESGKNSHKLINCGVITTPAHTSLSSRLEQIYDDMVSLLDLFKPDAVSIEELFFNTNITTGISVAHGRGVILLACRKYDVKVYEYTPGFIHAKCCIADGKAAMIGTINFDYRSFYLHFECGSVLYDCSVIKKIVRDFEKTVELSHLVTAEECAARPVLKKAAGAVLNMFAPLL